MRRHRRRWAAPEAVPSHGWRIGAPTNATRCGAAMSVGICRLRLIGAAGPRRWGQRQSAGNSPLTSGLSAELFATGRCGALRAVVGPPVPSHRVSAGRRAGSGAWAPPAPAALAAAGRRIRRSRRGRTRRGRRRWSRRWPRRARHGRRHGGWCRSTGGKAPASRVRMAPIKPPRNWPKPIADQPVGTATPQARPAARGEHAAVGRPAAADPVDRATAADQIPGRRRVALECPGYGGPRRSGR